MKTEQEKSREGRKKEWLDVRVRTVCTEQMIFTLESFQVGSCIMMLSVEKDLSV